MLSYDTVNKLSCTTVTQNELMVLRNKLKKLMCREDFDFVVCLLKIIAVYYNYDPHHKALVDYINKCNVRIAIIYWTPRTLAPNSLKTLLTFIYVKEVDTVIDLVDDEYGMMCGPCSKIKKSLHHLMCDCIKANSKDKGGYGSLESMTCHDKCKSLTSAKHYLDEDPKKTWISSFNNDWGDSDNDDDDDNGEAEVWSEIWRLQNDPDSEYHPVPISEMTLSTHWTPMDRVDPIEKLVPYGTSSLYRLEDTYDGFDVSDFRFTTISSTVGFYDTQGASLDTIKSYTMKRIHETNKSKWTPNDPWSFMSGGFILQQ